jgi:hypothetical protein
MKKMKFSAVAALVAALSACGGGGGGTSVAQVDLSGIAAKGLIQNGKVEVFATDSSGKLSSTPIATTVTGTDGSYTLKLAPQTNPVVVQVSKGTGTKIVDETAAAGSAALDMPDGFVMRAVVPEIKATSTVGINPYTETAVAAIPANGFSAAMVKSSNDWVKQNLTAGIDPVTVSPVLSGGTASANASDDQKSLAAALATVAVAAKSATGSCATEADTAAKFKCQVSKLSSSVSLSTNSSGTVFVSALDGSELAKIATARTTLATDASYSAAVSNLGVSAAANTLKSDSKLSTVVTTTGGAITKDAKVLANVEPSTETAITAGASATAYATNLKTAIKSSGDSVKAQVDKFNATYKDKVLPSLNTVTNALQMIDSVCSVNQTTIAVTCTPGTMYLNSGSATLAGSGNAYTYSGTGNGQKVSGDITFTPGATTLVMKVVGTVPNPESGATTPLSTDLQFTFMLDKPAMTFGVTIDKASVTFPAGTTIESTATISNGKIAGVLINGNAQQNCSSWPCTYVKQDSSSDQAGLLKSMTGVLTLTAKNGDKLSANIDAQMYVPSQAVWTSLTGQQRFAIKEKSMIDKLTFIAGIDLASGENYSVTIIADPDYGSVDLTKAPSSTNYAKGYMQLIVDFGKTSTSSLGKFDFKVDRATYTTAKPTLSFNVGTFDKLTAIPANTDSTYTIDVPTTAITDITTSASLWLDLKAIHNSLPDGIKITSTASEYVTSLKKDSSGNVNGSIKNKDGTAVGEVKAGVMYIDGSIFSLQ